MLESIKFENYRSCRSTTLEILRNVGALIGKNGVGKTNVLSGIMWMAGAARLSTPIAVETPREAKPGDPGLSVRATIKIDENRFEYSFSSPSVYEHVHSQGKFFVEERLVKIGTLGDRAPVFVRKGEEIKIRGKDDPIRVSPFSFSIGALMSLLPTEDATRKLLDPIASFLRGVSYYPLGDPAQGTDLIPESKYDEWVRSSNEAQTVTESVGLRLIHASKVDQDRWAEFKALIGPQGLNLAKRVEVLRVPIEVILQPQMQNQRPEAGSYYYVGFEPAPHMGGAGILFPFSELSGGSRRVIRVITALLFDKRSLLLMEQPEDSIHPGLLHKMIDLVRAYCGTSQIIFTTHSPEVLNVLAPEEVLLVTAPSGMTKVRRLSPKEILIAKRFLRETGSLSEFLDPLDE